MWSLLRKRVLLVKKPYLLKSVAFIHWRGNLKKELILKINVYCIMLLSPVRGKRRYFGCVGSGLKYIRYSPNVFISKLTELVNSASLFKIHWLIFYFQKLILKAYFIFKYLIYVHLQKERKNCLAYGILFCTKCTHKKLWRK